MEIALGAIFVYLMFWISASAYLFSIEEPKWKPGKVFGDYNWDLRAVIIFWINIAGGLWNLVLLMGMLNFTIVGSVCLWYFSANRQSGSRSWEAVGILFKYHLGTLLFGSLLICLFWPVQVVLNLIMSVLRDTDDAKDESTNCIVKFFTCCIDCIEGCLNFINKQAYAETMLKGNQFWAKKNRDWVLLEHLGCDESYYKLFGDFWVGPWGDRRYNSVWNIRNKYWNDCAVQLLL
jgi:solute carrier family 44 protein 1 (choline transporter-like protein)